MQITVCLDEGRATGEDSREARYHRFEDAANACLKAWEGDPAYRNAARKLKSLLTELDSLYASPGHRAALRATPPNASGQGGEQKGEYGEY